MAYNFRWVVLFCTFYINLVVDGYCLVSGILRLQFEMDYPDYPSWQISIISGLVPTLYLFLAPICIALTDYYGPCRIVFIAGILSTAGFFLGWLNSFLLNGYAWDLFTLGIMQGLSSALLYGPSIAAIPNYFPPNQRHFAAGITTCGSPIGAMIYGFIFFPVAEEYGFRGSLLIFAGFTLQVSALALCFKDSFKPREKLLDDFQKNLEKQQQEQQGAATSPPEYSPTGRQPNDSEAIPIPKCYIMTKISEDKMRTRLDTNHSLDNAIITADNALLRATQWRQYCQDNNISASTLNSLPPIDSGSSSDDEVDDDNRKESEDRLGQLRPALPRMNSTQSTASRQKSAYSRQNSALSALTQSALWIASTVMETPRKLRDVLKKYFSTKLLFQLSFLSLLVAAITSILGYYAPVILVVNHAENQAFGVSQPVRKYLVLMFGLFNTVGRLVTGRLADYGKIFVGFTSFSLFIVGQLVSAAALFIFPHFMQLGDVSFVLFIAVYAFFVAPLVTCRSLIVRDMYGRENANASFGWFLFAQGLVQIIGFVVPTMLDDLSPVYGYLFGAINYILSAFFVALTVKPFFKARQEAIEREEKVKERLLRHTKKTVNPGQ